MELLSKNVIQSAADGSFQCVRCKSTKFYNESNPEFINRRYVYEEVIITHEKCLLCGYVHGKKSFRNVFSYFKAKKKMALDNLKLSSTSPHPATHC